LALLLLALAFGLFRLPLRFKRPGFAVVAQVRVTVPAAPVDRDAGLPPVVGELLSAVPAHRALSLTFGCFLRETAPRLFGAAGEGSVPGGGCRSRALSRWLTGGMIFGSTGWEGASVGSASPPCKGHRYPVEVISHCVSLYFRFPLSFREVEELMLERGIVVSNETIRRWCAKFGQT
jgi:hypothetical protein